MGEKGNPHCAPDTSGAHDLSVDDLHAHYGRVCALHGVTFKVSCGRSVALVGGNGAGKTTLLRAIVGLVPATTGQVCWCGRPVQKSTYEIAYLPQREEIDWRFPLTVQRLVEMGRYPAIGSWGRLRQQDHEAVAEAMAAMRIEDLRGRQIGALSGGQQQRVFIARALAQKAHVLLLDEPFTGLDQPACEMLSELLRVLTHRGCLVIASHHDLRTVESVFDDVLLLRRRVVAFGSVGDVLNEKNLEAVFGA